MNNGIGRNFSPMGFEAVAQRIGNACGHDLDSVTEVIERDGYCAIKISEEGSTIKSYSFVLNFFNDVDNYADFFAFGITIEPETKTAVRDEKILSLLDMVFCLVNRKEFKEGTWDIAEIDNFNKPAIDIDLPGTKCGFHSYEAPNSTELIFVQDLTRFLEQVSKDVGNLNSSVWEYQNIDF